MRVKKIYTEEEAEDLFEKDWNNVLKDVENLFQDETKIRHDKYKLIRNFFAYQTDENWLIDLNEYDLWNSKLNENLEDPSVFLEFV